MSFFLFLGLLALIFGGLTLWFWPSPREENPWVTLLSSADSGELAVIKSLLEESEIPYFVRGEGVQDLMGIGRITGGYNLLTGPMELQVPKQDAEAARELLADFLTQRESDTSK